MRKLFNKPNWLKPEINEPKYWLHLVVIAVIVLWILENSNAFLNLDFSLFHIFGTMFNLKNILISVPLIGLGDLVAHTILRLD